MNEPTDEELNVKLAELCGWICQRATKDHPVEKGGYKLPNWFNESCDAWTHKDRPGVYAKPTRFCSDLNAVAEVERGLTDEQHGRFRVHLCGLIGTSGTADNERAYISSSAKLRTIALIATLTQ